MAVGGRTGRGCGLGGCGCVVAAVVLLGISGFVLIALTAADGDSTIGGVDVREFDVFGVSDAIEIVVEPVALQLDDEGGLEMTVELVRSGNIEAWDWTQCVITDHRLRVAGVERDGQAGTAPLIEPPVKRSTLLTFTADGIEAQAGESIRLWIRFRLRAEGMGGLTSVNMDRSVSVDLGRYGEWFDDRVTPISGHLSPPVESVGSGR